MSSQSYFKSKGLAFFRKGQLFCLLILIFYSATSRAQQNPGVFLMRDAFGINQLTPAYIPDKKFVIALPQINFQYQNSAGNFSDYISHDASGSPVLHLKPYVQQLDSLKNRLFLGGQLRTVGFGMIIHGWSFQLGHQIRESFDFVTPRALPQLISEGNKPFIGKKVSIAPNLNAIAFNDFNLGIAHKFGIVTVGARLHYLTGLGVAKTEKSSLDLYTSNDIYQLTLNRDILLHTASFADTSQNLNLKFSNLKTASGNSGFATDLGVTIDLRKFKLEIAVTDIGSIKWKHGQDFTSSGTIQYDGLIVSNVFANDSVGLDTKLDSLSKLLEFKNSSSSFTTQLPMNLYLAGSYMLNDKITLGASIQGYDLGHDARYSAALGLTYNLIKWLKLGANYTYLTGSPFNIGLQGSVKISGFRFYLATDNIIAAFTPLKSKAANFSAGAIFAFGSTAKVLME